MFGKKLIATTFSLSIIVSMNVNACTVVDPDLSSDSASRSAHQGQKRARSTDLADLATLAVQVGEAAQVKSPVKKSKKKSSLKGTTKNRPGSGLSVSFLETKDVVRFGNTVVKGDGLRFEYTTYPDQRISDRDTWAKVEKWNLQSVALDESLPLSKRYAAVRQHRLDISLQASAARQIKEREKADNILKYGGSFQYWMAISKGFIEEAKKCDENLAALGTNHRSAVADIYVRAASFLLAAVGDFEQDYHVAGNPAESDCLADVRTEYIRLVRGAMKYNLFTASHCDRDSTEEFHAASQSYLTNLQGLITLGAYDQSYTDLKYLYDVITPGMARIHEHPEAGENWYLDEDEDHGCVDCIEILRSTYEKYDQLTELRAKK
jgi:hypothetical protein